MGDALSLDHETVAAQTAGRRYAEADPWLARRAPFIGASEVAAALVAYGGTRPPGPLYAHLDAPTYVREAAARVAVQTRSRVVTVPLFVARKAGYRKPQRSSDAMSRGTRREADLIATWWERQSDCAHRLALLPRNVLPLKDGPSHRTRLSCTPDAWALSPFDELIVIEAKCPRTHYEASDPLPWWWRVQVQAQIAVCDAFAGVLVCGPGWGASDGVNTDPISWSVERDDSEIEEIRRVSAMAAMDMDILIEEA